MEWGAMQHAATRRDAKHAMHTVRFDWGRCRQTLRLVTGACRLIEHKQPNRQASRKGKLPGRPTPTLPPLYPHSLTC